jgi:hypothetical protein
LDVAALNFDLVFTALNSFRIRDKGFLMRREKNIQKIGRENQFNEDTGGFLGFGTQQDDTI